MIAALLAFVGLVSVASGQTIAQVMAKMPKTFTFKPDGATGAKIDSTGTYNNKSQRRVSYYLADYTNGYSNPKFEHCVLLDCTKEVRCTDFARYSQDNNGEDTECTFEHHDVPRACDVHSRLNTYDYYQQWWATVYPDEVDIMSIQCFTS